MEFNRYIRARNWPVVAGYLLFIGMMTVGYAYNVTFIQLGLKDLGERVLGMPPTAVAWQMAGLALLTEDGQIVFSTNARNFKLDVSLREDCYLKEITGITTTEDFRRKPLHRCWVLAKQESALKIPQL